SFFLELLPKLKKEFSCSVDPRLEQPEEMKIIATPLEKGSQHALEWDVELSLKRKQTESEAEVNINELISAMKRGERFLPTDVGTIDLSDSRLHWLEAMKGKRVQKLKKGWRLTPIDLFRIEAYEPVSFVSGVEQKAIFERLLQCRPHTPPDISELHSELRTYQKNGVEWLWFLYQNGLSGLLCDDMGVGKTHQAMGLMAAIFHEKKQENARPIFLIIAPTSLIFHWEEKLKTYLPNLKVKTYVGLGRTLDDFPGNCDILLTSYGIFRNEALSFKRFFFDAAFFDELQIAKNHVSQIYAALLRIRARLKIGLTGTPIENQLRELKTLFDLVLPGYMPEDSDFREFFVKPLERGDTPDRRSLLARFVKPFVLRRRKQDVLPELPEKTEDFYYAELIGEQKTLYKQVAMRESRSLIDLISKEAEPIPYMHIFALLSALKQISNHPACYLKDVGNYERYESGKWEAFCELLEEAQESQQKVVVFSQYLAMLDIMATYLDQSKISYAQIRGETKNRGQEVGRFRDDPDCRVFLGSLHAAGLGIDLTSASIVIHYDRWWNAARENQATDRVHRLGQTRGVQVYKLITKHSIEEKIDLMISKKQNLLEEIVSV
ncbi:MAG TPA: DEAD/DEAH box helicase, partial [Chlamydiales bacterium]|nr:DEAD/DEAH box helicase [Chlamydiales bacterium]